MWYDPRNVNDRGNEKVKFIAEAELALLDKNKTTHFGKVNKTKSHVDISIFSPELLTILNWDVYEEPLDSDHLPIIIESKTQQHHVSPVERGQNTGIECPKFLTPEILLEVCLNTTEKMPRLKNVPNVS